MKKFSVIVCLMVFTMVANAEIVVFQNSLANDYYPTVTTDWTTSGYQGVDDSMTCACSSYVNLNYGGREKMSVGNPNYGNIQQGLLKWDLSALNAGEIITGATLELWSRGVAYYGEQEFSVHEMWPVNGGWLEGDKTGATATGDEVTHNNKSFSDGTTWAGGYGPLNFTNPAYTPPYLDYDMTPIATFMTTGNLTTTGYQQYLTEVPASIIQTWVGEAAKDVAGLILHANFMREFDPDVDPWHYPYTSPAYLTVLASEYAPGQVAYPFRPKLTLDIVPEPMTMILVGLGGLFLRRRK